MKLRQLTISRHSLLLPQQFLSHTRLRDIWYGTEMIFRSFLLSCWYSKTTLRVIEKNETIHFYQKNQSCDMKIKIG